MAAQFKTFWDSTGQLWQKGLLYGKPFGIFTSTATQGGGQELTISNCEPNNYLAGMDCIISRRFLNPVYCACWLCTAHCISNLLSVAVSSAGSCLDMAANVAILG